MTPIAIKSFGIDETTGLEKQLQVTSVFCDAELEQITVQYKLVWISPTGLSMNVIQFGKYVRYGAKFQTLRSSGICQGITSLITDDLNMILSYDSIDADLKQAA